VPLGTVLIVLLALVWAIVLLPSLFKSRAKSSPINGVRSFERAMGVLSGARSGRSKDQPTGRWIMVPRSDVTAPVRRRARVIRRRRRNFLRTLAVVAGTLGLSFVPGLRWMLAVHAAADLSLAFYIWRLRRWKVGEELRRSADEPVLMPEPEPELARQTG
jgi:hypothetical protein